MTKKLEAGTYAWPTGNEAGKAKLSLRAGALEMLLSGIDLCGFTAKTARTVLPGATSEYARVAATLADLIRGMLMPAPIRP